MSHWDDTIKVFWRGDWREFIAWKGSHQVFVYPTDEHPAPPSYIIQHSKRIETLDDFNDVLETGQWMKVSYTETEEPK